MHLWTKSSTHINVNRDRYIEELKQYLAIPSISALPQHAGDVRRCAEWTAEEMKRIGLQTVRVEETPGHPAVYGEWLGAEGAPTILFYGHYDVQPVDPVNLWTSPPFEATVRDGELYARGAVDDKGQVFMHFKAVEAHMKANGRLPVNMKFLIEGEEEVGSANLDNYVQDRKSQLASDVVVISDSPMFDRGIPVDLLRPARAGVLPDRSARHEIRSSLRFVRRRGRQPGDGARADPRADEGQERPRQDSGLLRRCRRAEAGGAGGVREAAVQREEVPAGSRRPEAVRRNRLHHARAHLGAADVRGQRPARQASRAKARRR